MNTYLLATVLIITVIPLFSFPVNNDTYNILKENAANIENNTNFLEKYSSNITETAEETSVKSLEQSNIFLIGY